MAQAGFEDLVETFEFLDDWEERYRHVIELGKALPDMPEALKVPATQRSRAVPHRSGCILP